MNDDDIDYEQAAQELLIEAKQGNTESQCLLGQMYYEGVGVKQDYKQAILWFTKAAKHKHAEAQYYLGLQYQNGQGVKQNQKEAETWFQKSAKLGNIDAKAVLAEIEKSKVKVTPSVPNTVNVNSVSSVDKTKESPVSESSAPAANISESHGDSKIKKIIIIAAVLVILGVAGYFEYSRVMLDKAKSKHEEELTHYKRKLSSAVETMFYSTFTAENTCSLIHEVWYNSIHKKRSNKTDKYTTGYGIFYDDFNIALQKLMSSSEFTSKINSIKGSQKNTEEAMKSLKNPPEEFKSAYSLLLNLYEAYTEFNDLAINPKGTLVSYTASYNNVSASFLKYHKMIQIYL